MLKSFPPCSLKPQGAGPVRDTLYADIIHAATSLFKMLPGKLFGGEEWGGSGRERERYGVGTEGERYGVGARRTEKKQEKKS